MDNHEPKLGPFGIRSFLLAVHRDLLRVHAKVTWQAEYGPNKLSHLELMVLALEDRRFMHHIGVDGISGARELLRAAAFQRHGGASTIDMQFVRTATGYRKRRIGRKLYEMFLAIIIQYRYPKLVILRAYLNCAFFGSRMIGAERTAFTVFGVGPDELTLDQASEIAAMLVYPRPLDPDKGWQSKVRRRAKYGMRVYTSNKEKLEQVTRG